MTAVRAGDKRIKAERFYVGRPVGSFWRVIDREYAIPGVRVYPNRKRAYAACERLNHRRTKAFLFRDFWDYARHFDPPNSRIDSARIAFDLMREFR